MWIQIKAVISDISFLQENVWRLDGVKRAPRFSWSHSSKKNFFPPFASLYAQLPQLFSQHIATVRCSKCLPLCDLRYGAVPAFLIRRNTKKEKICVIFAPWATQLNQRNELMTVINHFCYGTIISQNTELSWSAHIFDTINQLLTAASCISLPWTSRHVIPLLSPHRCCIRTCPSACACLSPSSLTLPLVFPPPQELPGLHAHEVDSVQRREVRAGTEQPSLWHHPRGHPFLHYA